MSSIISIPRSIIPAIDTDDILLFEKIVKETCDFKEVGAYKLGATIGLKYGLNQIVKIARQLCNKPLIYDHQKAGTDIPDTGKAFTKMLKDCGMDALIIFPLTGPASQVAWIKAAQEVELPIIAGGLMTHEKFLSSEGGYIDDKVIEKMYSLSATNGIRDFVVPGNKPDSIKKIRESISSVINSENMTFYSPGFVTQGGKITDAAIAAGNNWHAIVGRAIYEAPNIRASVEILISELK